MTPDELRATYGSCEFCGAHRMVTQHSLHDGTMQTVLHCSADMGHVLCDDRPSMTVSTVGSGGQMATGLKDSLQAMADAFSCSLIKGHQGVHEAYDVNGDTLAWWEQEPPPSRHTHITRDIKPKGECPMCDEYWAKQEAKVVIKREVEIWVDVDPTTFVMSAQNIDLLDGETIPEFVARQKANGDTAWDFARELDLFENPTVHLSIVEHYDDGTSKHVEGGEWSDQSDD